MSQDFSEVEIRAQNSKILTFCAFCRGYHFSHQTDLRKVVSQFPQGIVACSAFFVAGREHIDSLLVQTAEYWSRGFLVARNKSIDLLMRVTCQTQISKAIDASGIEKSRDVALFGLANNTCEIRFVESLITESGGIRNDRLLNLNPKKVRFLKEIHSLPAWLQSERIANLLQEKAAILVFSK
jgi:tRNA threonylcarbamoyladenosine modification (KEOPS) complex Cgi121 subunit